jgi:hypothetical protein
MTDIINKNVIENPNPKSSNAILIDTAGTDLETSYPNGVYAILTLPISEASGTRGSAAENTAYQDTLFSNQLSADSGSAVQVTSNAKKGWMSIAVDPDSSDVVYIGASGVTSSNGFILKAANSPYRVSNDDLSDWYVIGASGGETVYVVGAYIA